MSKFERHIAKPVAVELTNKDGQTDEFLIKPLPFEMMPEFYKLMKHMAKIDFKKMQELPDDEKGKALIESLPDETFNLMVKLIRKSLEISYPEVPKEQRDALASSHMMELLNAVFEANSHEEPPKTKGQSS